ncbi:MAG TPA: ABC transporter ATP-binding protein [Rhizobium sp.]
MDMPASRGTPRIEVIDLVKSYRREGGARITPVDHVNLTVAEKELVVLLGPSGCGKTTLLRCVAGLERPDEGEIIIEGETVFSSKKGIYEPPDRRKLSMVFQSYALWPHLSVADNVAYPLHSRKTPKETISKRVSDVLSMVGVGGLEHQYPDRISGGQQQRVALARALVANSSVVLFDEPLSNVDAQVRAQLRFELQSMQSRVGLSGLYVTHDQVEAMELGHRVAVLDSGRISALGAPFDIYSNPPNEYVAKFVGVANMLPGTLSARSDKRIVIDAPIGALTAPESGLMDASLRVGDSVSVVTRPEHLSLSSAKPASDDNTFMVKIEAKLFSGAHTDLLVRAGDTKLSVWMHDYHAATALGAESWLTVSASALRVVARKGGQNG